MNRHHRGALAIAVMAALACSAEPQSAAPMMGVDITVSSAGVRAMGHFDPQARILGKPRSEHYLLYEFRSANGDLLSSGRVDDPRYIRVEIPDLEAKTLTRIDDKTDGGWFGVRLPNASGELFLYERGEDDLVLLGSTAISRAPVLQRAARHAADDGDIEQTRCRSVDGEDGSVCANLLLGSGDTRANVDVVLIADGFADDELGGFHDMARKLIERLNAVPDYGDYFHRFNFWLIEKPVETTGDTRFDIQTESDGSYPNYASDDGRQKARDFASIVDADVVGVIYNTPEHGGYGRAAAWSGGNIPTFTSGLSANTAHGTLPHELGHALFAVGDEYGGTGGCSNSREYPNIAYDEDDLPWADMVNTSVPTIAADEYECNVDIPEDGICQHSDRDLFDEAFTAENYGLVGAYEGGTKCDVDRWHPSLHCLMGSHYGGFYAASDEEFSDPGGLRDPGGDIPGSKFCPVCRREMDRFFENIEDGLGDDCPETWRDDGFCDGCLDDDPDCCGWFEVGCFVERALCGDGVCQTTSAILNYSEDEDSCPIDCSPDACGDGECRGLEDPDSCAQDCGCAAIDPDQFVVCESVAPWGCWCDSACEARGDCCGDAQATCGDSDEWTAGDYPF